MTTPPADHDATLDSLACRRRASAPQRASASHTHRDDHDHHDDHSHEHAVGEDAAHPGHGHGHGHSHPHRGLHAHTHADASTPERRLWAALALTAAFMASEVAAATFSHSVALLSDAGHMLADSGSLVLALIAQRFARLPHDEKHTYGFQRAEILAAMVNGLLLLMTAALVVREALERWTTPTDVRGDIVTAVGFAGLVVNVVIGIVLATGAKRSLNVRAALVHVVSDAVGSVLAMTAGVLAWKFGVRRADPVLSIVMAVLIVGGAWTVLRGTASVLMQRAPSGLDLEGLGATIRGTTGVTTFHDLHAWSVAEGVNVVTVHVECDGSREAHVVATDVAHRIEKAHGVQHVTVQPEARLTSG